MSHSDFSRRSLLLGGAAGVVVGPKARAWQPEPLQSERGRLDYPVLVGSANALPGMQANYKALQDGADPLDVALEVVKIVEADPTDMSVGLGGLPNEDGVVQLDSACMHGPTHNSGAVACIENILHPCEVAKLVMERTDHCLIVGRGAYDFARSHGHPHTELMTEATRKVWMEWKESMSNRDDRLSPPKPEKDKKQGSLEAEGQAANRDELARLARQRFLAEREWGTIHCSALSVRGEVGCTTTTSGLAWKIPGRVGDSPIVGAGLYCDQEGGSAGGTGRGESAILANASFAVVELMRQGAKPLDAGLEALRRVARQVKRQSSWQSALMDEQGRPTFGLKLYVLGLDGTVAGVSLLGGGKFSTADPVNGPRHEELVPLFER